MSEREDEIIDAAVDPPSNDGGTTSAPSGISLDATTTETARSVDPPSNDGGTK